MDRASRPSGRDLVDELRAKAPRYRFFQAVRVLALCQRRNAGNTVLPSNLRFNTPATLSFPASEISTVEPRNTAGQDAPAFAMQVNFLGLTGPSGILPTHYTEMLIDRRQYHRDITAHAFFDLFSHRAISLFYAAWRKYRFYLPFEQGERDGFTRNLMDLAGVGLAHLQQRLQEETPDVSPLFFAYYSGLLSQKPVSASALSALVEGYFKVPAALEQFVGQWLTLPQESRSYLGQQANQLGVSACAGERGWDQQTKIRLRLGPLAHARFSEFMPGKPAARALAEILKFCIGHDLACEVRLTLKKNEIPLPLMQASQAGLRLGQNIWLRSRPLKKHADDMAYLLLQ